MNLCLCHEAHTPTLPLKKEALWRVIVYRSHMITFAHVQAEPFCKGTEVAGPRLWNGAHLSELRNTAPILASLSRWRGI